MTKTVSCSNTTTSTTSTDADCDLTLHWNNVVRCVNVFTNQVDTVLDFCPIGVVLLQLTVLVIFGPRGLKGTPKHCIFEHVLRFVKQIRPKV